MRKMYAEKEMNNEDFGGSEKGSTIRLNKVHNHVVGGMIFDSEAMCWRSREVDGEDELLLESDEQLEMRWQADDEGSNTGGVGVDLAQSEWNDSGRLIDRGNNEVKQEGKFWDDCVEAEIRHLKEITPHPPNRLFSHEYQHHRPAPISSQPSRGFSARSPNLSASISSSSYSDLNASPASMALISSEIRVGVMRMIRPNLIPELIFPISTEALSSLTALPELPYSCDENQTELELNVDVKKKSVASGSLSEEIKNSEGYQSENDKSEPIGKISQVEEIEGEEGNFL
ncbi:hypothetical protein PPACK8108_LOCUS2183 [Phakopsora pachyrhizi]|uniref:Uncharacterized protein n=1 Tax=Phakopsora pachyrhizi TaxID=170000 RepID=A0AAV0AHT8_PHAPC|nr:hypothetical protein PPACK8108_LOCUS2183 [Phakopsora pachyrhizi]